MCINHLAEQVRLIEEEWEVKRFCSFIKMETWN